MDGNKVEVRISGQKRWANSLDQLQELLATCTHGAWTVVYMSDVVCRSSKQQGKPMLEIDRMVDLARKVTNESTDAEHDGYAFRSYTKLVS